jgi:predicted nucleic-acid-binding Zn-ribbon protein
MKFNYSCQKCQCSEIAKIEGGAFKGNVYNTISSGMSAIYLTRYVCTNCGFSENYVDDPKDLAKIKEKFYQANENNDFV